MAPHVAQRLLDDAQHDRLGRPVEADVVVDGDADLWRPPVPVEVDDVGVYRRGQPMGDRPRRLQRTDGQHQLTQRLGLLGEIVT